MDTCCTLRQQHIQRGSDVHKVQSGDVDDWDSLEVRPGHPGVQNVLYLNDEEEEDGEEIEQGQEGRNVTKFGAEVGTDGFKAEKSESKTNRSVKLSSHVSWRL
ncbi:hypothetical protein EYF80_055889 [Liparis tanakae]|uniref:Uncharacterized protein n=1 Tax=Liparis tanakae TaxID=230148 RepID=A0A4Z2EYI1_9TELE|nr:hypothetical protein EYF80_055889 [Liparis tanakae]